MNKKNLLIIIPSRSGSKGIKSKNIIKINNKPLLYYSINTAIKFKCKNKIVFCSTDSKKIAKISETFKVKVPFLRPKNISGDLSRDIEYVNHALKKFSENKIFFKFGLILRPTSPKRNLSILQIAYKKFKKYNYDSLRSVIESPYPVYKQWFIEKKELKSVIKSNIYEHYNAPRQILKKTYAQSGNFEYFKINYKIKIKSISGKKIGYYLTTNKLENDIDTMKDLKKFKLYG
tara:strand:+ start:6351 stop:7046 length:696 start_codon:yes stop_codon:yes gene_type:complete